MAWLRSVVEFTRRLNDMSSI